ncbi:MAG: TetR/AcrR family transcriptional regulator [Myxococcota bacterium]
MPKIVDHEQRRTDIARAAATIIATRGIDAVTMVGIGEAAGMTTGAVTHYFEDKEQVILAALRWADGAMQARAARAFEQEKDVVSIALAALPHDAESRVEWLVWAVFSDRATRSETLMVEQRQRDEDWHALALSVLSDLAKKGHLDPNIDIDIEASIAVALIDGIGFHAAWDPGTWPEERQRRALEQYLDRFAPRPGLRD